MGFRDIPQPFVCGVLVDDSTVDGVTRTMKLAEYEGADVFDFELQSLDPVFRNPDTLRTVFEATTRPILRSIAATECADPPWSTAKTTRRRAPSFSWS